MIPRKIHFIWIGGGAVTAQVATFVLWWRKLMPDYQLVVWDKSRYEAIADKPRYVEEAYAERKWAFVCDWLRAYVLYKEGGWWNVRGAQTCTWQSFWHADVGWNDAASP